MGWSPTSATNAYLDTLKLLRGKKERSHDGHKTLEPESNEFISALAAGMSAKLIVEVSSEASPSTIALAAAARQTGGKLVCILPKEEILAESKEVIQESGLKEMVEFKVGDPYELLPKYENIDFSLVDCKKESYRGLLKLLDVNPRSSVVVANNLNEGRGGLEGDVKGFKGKAMVKSKMRPIGKRMEVTMIGECSEYGKGSSVKGTCLMRKRPGKSRWFIKVDEKSGEEHIYRVLNSL